MSEQNVRPIFIVGTGRSGTTILKRALLQHPHIVGLPGELRILTDPGGAADLAEGLSERWGPYYGDNAVHRFVRIIQDASVEPGWRRKQIDRFQLRILVPLRITPRRYLGSALGNYPDILYLHSRLQRLIAELSVEPIAGRWMGTPAFQRPSMFYETVPLPPEQASLLVAQFFTDLYAHIASPVHTHWLDDTPTMLVHAHRLQQLFPDMKLIHIIRDPRDVLASYVGFAWGGKDYLLTARRLAAFYERWLDVRQHLPSESFIEVHLETLAADPESTYQTLCEFSGVPFAADLLQISLDQANTGRWQSDIPAADWQACEPILQPFVDRFGYN